MDAREYMARKGLDAGRDQERPNTLEEKAWSRAREAGEHRPRAGTPFDWEDWERYHETLAEGAESLEQKIDHEAHRRALDHEAGAGVEHFTPAAGAQARVEAEEPVVAPLEEREADEEPSPDPVPTAGARTALQVLAVLLPPLAVGLAHGGAPRVAIGLALTLLGWLPGAAYALWWLHRSAP